MRRLTLLLALVCICTCMGAQVPQSIAYQAVLRNSDGTVIANEDVVVRIGLLKGSASGSVVYSEQHSVKTSAQGIISLALGAGTQNVQGNFTAVPWGQEIFIKIEIKRSGSSDFVAMEPSKVLAVPYAMRAQHSQLADTAQIADTAKAAKALQHGPLAVLPTKSAKAESPIFVVKNSEGKVVFAVYNDGIRSYVGNTSSTSGFVVETQANKTSNFIVSSDSARVYFDNKSKGGRSGFAVGGRAGQKALGDEYFAVSPYLTEVYFDTTITKGGRSGFAVGGRAGQKGSTVDYLTVTPKLTEFSFDAATAKGGRSGFAVGGRAGQKGDPNSYLSVAPGLTQVQYDYSTLKGGRSGFAVGGRAGQKATATDMLFVNGDSTRVYFDDSNTAKGGRSGFAVGGRAGQKGVAGYDFLKIGVDSASVLSIIPNAPDPYSDNNQLGGFDIGGLSSQNPEYKSFFSVNANKATAVNIEVPTGTIDVKGDLVPNYDPTDVADGSGNWYKTIKIGNARWLKSNLRATRYSDESLIDTSLFTKAETNADTLGHYYSKSVIESDNNVCPEGWHISTLDDWNALREEFSGYNVVELEGLFALPGHWDLNRNITATDSIGFSMPAAGSAAASQVTGIGSTAIYWLGGYSDKDHMLFSGDTLDGPQNPDYSGDYRYSVRCVKGHIPLTISLEVFSPDNSSGRTYWLSGSVLYDGGSAVVESGVSYGATEEEVYAFAHKTAALSLSQTEIKAHLTNLTPSTSYFAALYAINATDTVFSHIEQFGTKAASVPQLGNVTVEYKSYTQATVTDSIVDNGGYEVTERGFVISINKENNQGVTTPPDTIRITDATAAFTYDIILKSDAFYSVMPYAINQVGTSMEGNFVEVMAPYQSFELSVPDTLTGIAKDSISFTGSIYIGSNSENFEVTQWGICYGAEAESDTSGSHLIGTGACDRFSDVTINALESGVLYHFRPYAVTRLGICYGSDVAYRTKSLPSIKDVAVKKGAGVAEITISVNNGGLNIDSCGIIVGGVSWKSEKIVDNQYIVSYIFEVIKDTTIYFSPYVRNSLGMVKGDSLGIAIAMGISISTDTVINISYTKATVKGTLNSDVFAPEVTLYYRNRPFYVEGSIDTSSSVQVAPNYSELSADISNLIPDTTYYAKFVAVISGTVVGDTIMSDELSFKTLTYGTSAADGDGNTYKTVIINGTEWFAENLKTTKYFDGTVIPVSAEFADWTLSGRTGRSAYGYPYDEETGAYNSLKVDLLGLIYNGYAVITDSLCPIGWQVPTSTQTEDLANYVCRSADALLLNGSNSYLFNAIQVNARDTISNYLKEEITYFWTQTDYSKSLRSLGVSTSMANAIVSTDSLLVLSKGTSVRCVKSKAPIVYMEVSNITTNGATFVGKLQASDASITKQGFVYSYGIDNVPSINGSSIDAPLNGTTFSTVVNMFEGKSTYLVRAFVQTSTGEVSYSRTFTLTTLTPDPEFEGVGLQGQDQVSLSLSCNGRFLKDTCGFCYSTVENPTINDPHVGQPAKGESYEAFFANIEKLTHSTKYYVRAYTYSEGRETVYYSSNYTFTTDAVVYGETVKDGSGNDYTTVSIDGVLWISSNLRTESTNSGSAIPEASMAVFKNTSDVDSLRIFGRLYSGVYATDDVCPTGYSIADSLLWAEMFTNKLFKQITLAQGWTFGADICSNATELSIPAAGYSTAFTNAGTDAYFWSDRANTGSFAHLSYNSTQGGSSMQLENELPNDALRSIRCVKYLRPKVATDSVTQVDSNNDKFWGTISNYGNVDAPSEYGFVFSEYNNLPTVGDTILKANSVDESGSFSLIMDKTKLGSSYTYYVRAYAINSQGISYGEVVAVAFTAC